MPDDRDAADRLDTDLAGIDAAFAELRATMAEQREGMSPDDAAANEMAVTICEGLCSFVVIRRQLDDQKAELEKAKHLPPPPPQPEHIRQANLRESARQLSRLGKQLTYAAAKAEALGYPTDLSFEMGVVRSQRRQTCRALGGRIAPMRPRRGCARARASHRRSSRTTRAGPKSGDDGPGEPGSQPEAGAA